jgi:fructose-specific phosphotransferase system IIA component
MLLLIFLLPMGILASSGDDVTRTMMIFVFQIAVAIFAAKGVGALFKRLSLPSVLGELSAGIIIGPYLLGSIGFLSFSEGLFPVQSGTLPVSAEIYGIATIASILLLFMVGLETDIEMFKRYSLAGLIVGVGGIAGSFSVGAGISIYFMELPLFSPAVLFMGVVSTATSVGITARILSERKSIDSPEGVTILAGAVVDDIIGIILLTITLGIANIMETGDISGINWFSIGEITLKALTVFALFLGLGLVFAHKISALLKKSGDRYSITMLSLGIALLVAGIFEQAGLAMIIGAYVTGLSLSKTDISYVIQETLQPLQNFFVPLFFVIMGMLVDVKVFVSKEVLVFGIVFSAGAIVSKFIGCGAPSLWLGFNKYGATRIGLGMIPRGEVALIIAGVGFSSGVLNSEMFGVVIMMTLVSTFIAPYLLNISLKANGKGTNREPVTGNTLTTEFVFDSELITSGVVNHIRDYLNSEGFYIYMMEVDCKVYQMRKDKLFIKMSHYPEKLHFVTSEADTGFVKVLVYEAFVELFHDVERISENGIKGNIVRNIGKDKLCPGAMDFEKILDPDCIKTELESTTKEGVVKELISMLHKKGYINNPDEVTKEILEREKIVSTGFENGFACPHARLDSIDHIHLAMGIAKKGINFDSFDKKPAKVIAMLISSTKNPEHHIETLSALASIFINNGGMQKILKAETPDEILRTLYELSSTKCINN